MAGIPRKLLISLGLLLVCGILWTSESQSQKSPVAGKATKKRVAETVSHEVRLTERTSGSLIVEWDCPPIEVVRDEITDEVTAIHMKGVPSVLEAGVPELPRMSQLIDCLPGKVRLQILEREVETVQLGVMQPQPEDYIIGHRPTGDSGTRSGRGSADPLWGATRAERIAATPLKPGFWPEQGAEVNEGGVFRGHRLISLLIHPVQVDARAGTAQVLRRIRVRVLVPPDEGAAERLPDRPEETAMLQKLLGSMRATARRDRMPEAFEGRGRPERVMDEEPYTRYKLIVNVTGVVRVTGADLEFAFVPIDQIDPATLHIRNKGAEVPIHMVGGFDGRFDPPDYFEFFGERNQETANHLEPTLYQDPYSEDNVYWMTWGDGQAGLRMGQEDGSWHPSWRARDVRHVRTSIHFENDENFERLQQSSDYLLSELRSGGPLSIVEDYWYWDERIDAQTSREFEVNVSFPDPDQIPGAANPVTLRAALQGFSWGIGVPYSDHHRATISMNGFTDRGLSIGQTFVGDTSQPWTGQTAVIVQSNPLSPTTAGLTTTELFHGDNMIRVDVPGDGLGGLYDKILVNWFELEYDRDTRARSGRIRFRFDEARGDTFAFDLRGFAVPEIEVWKLGRSRLTNLDRRLVTPADEAASYAARFHLVSDESYDIFAFDRTYVRPPFMIVADSADVELRSQLGAQYLLIAHDSFIGEPALQRLDSMRRQTFGGSVMTIPVGEVYEQFSHGIESPMAIRDFLRYAYEEWSVRPTHVCLVGDAVLRQRFNNRPGNLISSLFPQTPEFGISAADGLFGSISGPPWDIIPDIAVGRISCRTPEELETYVSKVYAYEYESDYEGAFHSRVMMVADHNDSQFNFVTSFSENVIRLFPDDINIHRVYLDSIAAGQGFTRLRDALRDGSLVVNYNGHGGGGVWSGTQLINSEGVGLLTGQRTFPFITNFTCYVGAFDDERSDEVLGEVFLFDRNTVSNDLVGATGFYSSSGVGWAGAGLTMQKSLFGFLLDRPGVTYGEAVMLNKATYWASQTGLISFTSTYAMVMMMNLLGDPGIRLALPDMDLEPQIAEPSNVVVHGQGIRVMGTLPWEPSPGQPTFLYPLAYNGDLYEPIVVQVDPPPAPPDTIDYRFIATRTPVFDQDRVSPMLIDDQEFVSDTFTIGSRFVTPRGRVVVYATDPFTERDAIGSFPIYLSDSLSSVQIFDVEPYPSSIIIQDSSFYVRATILHQNQVESVRMRGIFRPPQGPVVLDTLMMSEEEPGVWTSTLLGPYPIRGGQYRVQFFVTPVGLETMESRFYELRSESPLDFSMVNVTGVPPGERSGSTPYFYHPIRALQYTNSPPVPLLKVRLDAISQDTVWLGFFPVVTTVDSFSAVLEIENVHEYQAQFDARIPSRFRPRPYWVTVRVDPDNEIPESSELNNSSRVVLEYPSVFPVQRSIGTYYKATEYFPMEIGPHRYWGKGGLDTLYLQIPPGQLPVDSTTLVYFPPRAPSAAELSTLARTGLYPVFEDRGIQDDLVQIFRVTQSDTTERLESGTTALIQMEQIGYDSLGATRREGRFAIFEHREGSDFWRMLEGGDVGVEILDTALVPVSIDPQTEDTTLGVRLVMEARGEGIAYDLGEYAIFELVDETGPYIEIAVGGIRFTKNSIVPARPEMYANLSDPLGIDRSGGRFFMILDGDTVPDWEISWSDTLEWGGATSALIRPDLEPGEHTVEVYATDNAGNSSTYSADFIVRGEFGIEWAINYPNPFEKRTKIAYVLTGATNQPVEIKIYTVSGRLIRTLRDPERETANYRSQVWRGVDDSGEEVANGVYFAKIIAKQDDQTVEKVVKLAKLR